MDGVIQIHIVIAAQKLVNVKLDSPDPIVKSMFVPMQIVVHMDPVLLDTLEANCQFLTRRVYVKTLG